MRIRTVGLGVLAVWAAAGAASADVMGDLTTSGVCWLRTYDAAHLRAHPRQRVIEFGLVNANLLIDPSARRAGEVSLGFTFQLRGERQAYNGMAVCRRAGAGADCGVEGDGGRFRLDPRPGGGLRLTVSRLVVEGDNGFSPDLGASDDRVLDLTHARGRACEVQTAASM